MRAMAGGYDFTGMAPRPEPYPSVTYPQVGVVCRGVGGGEGYDFTGVATRPESYPSVTYSQVGTVYLGGGYDFLGMAPRPEPHPSVTYPQVPTLFLFRKRKNMILFLVKKRCAQVNFTQA